MNIRLAIAAHLLTLTLTGKVTRDVRQIHTPLPYTYQTTDNADIKNVHRNVHRNTWLR